MNKFQDMTGMKFGRLTVLERVPNLPNSRVTRWKCRCECGKIVEANRNNLLKEHVKSCGCLSTELKKQRSKKYNLFMPIYIGYTLNTNRPFIVDYEDYEKIKKYCWHETQYGYIATRNPDTKRIMLLHKLIMGEEGIVDHINRNRTDNRKVNLRIVTHQENSINKSMQKNNRSGITGVFYDKQRNKWASQLTFKGKKHFKRFNDKEEAIKYRKNCEQVYFKEYAPQ